MPHHVVLQSSQMLPVDPLLGIQGRTASIGQQSQLPKLALISPHPLLAAVLVA